jgi:hypothetical protein
MHSFCPDRHINDDGLFCLGLRAGEGITVGTAAAWWSEAALFSALSGNGCRKRVMARRHPDIAWRSRGHRASRRERCCRPGLAAGLPRGGRVRHRSHCGGVSKIKKETGLLRNVRSACPCGRTDGRGNALLRRECHRLGCPIVFEYERRDAVDRFWLSMQGRPCCGTMRQCQLKP